MSTKLPMSAPPDADSPVPVKDPYLAASLPWTNRAARVAWALGYAAPSGALS